ncbi:hypothetical protein [Actinokineospora sp. NPDC004072]
MRRLPRALLGALGVLSLITVAPPTAAVAATTAIGGGLQCTIYPYRTYPPVYSTNCLSPRPSYSSTIHFKVLAPSPAYTYSWSLSGAPLPSTCNSTASTCTVAVNTTRVDRFVTAVVTVSGNGESSQFTSEGWAFAACPGPTGVEFC